MRMVKNLVAIYARAPGSPGSTEKGLDLLTRSDLKAFSYREILGKSKVIHFYDLSLLNDMTTLYGRASIAYLEKAAGDPKVRDAVEFHLGQAYALFGSIEESSKVTASFIATSQMPQSYKDRIRVWQGANLYAKNRRTEAMAVWDELMRKQPEDPDLIAEILFACHRMKADCPKVLQKAAAMVETGEGKKLALLNIATGTYILGRQDPAKAASYLEAGRDKSNKNKIESNDPEMLVSLADAYYRTKKFSEALEIYFEMSKQFPEVRQIQDAIQGIYAMEQKSAGDVKIN
jgi:tetratricopeptide (TPR) repeat protein